MPQPTVMMIIVFLITALYVPIIVQLMRHHEGQEAAATLLSAYALIALGIGVGEGLWRGGIWQVSQLLENDLQIYGAYVLSVIMMVTVLRFIRRDFWAWTGIGIGWGLLIVVIVANVLGLGDVVWTNGSVILTRDRLGPALAAFGWFVFTIGALVIVRVAHARSRQPLLRNRLNYWVPVFIFIFVNDLLIILNRQIPANPLRLVAVFMAAYIIFKHNPPDLRLFVRDALTYVITIFIVIAFYVAGFTILQNTLHELPNYNPLLIGAGMAILVSFIYTPLLTIIRNTVKRWFRMQEIHATKTLHAYSQQISNILDMQKLANVAVGLIIEAMDITRGFLFLVDTELNEAAKSYNIRAVRNPGERQIKILTLAEDSPIVKHFLQDQTPLLQYDLDLLPVYRPVSTPDREWFQRLEGEVYLPIFSKREWIGLLALGPKISGNRYTEENLVTLATLANQTAVALENARLVENLIQLNTELRQAYRDLDRANRDLERLDQTKSDFINIASHELRTPLTTMIGYTDLLLEDEALAQDSKIMLDGISKGTHRLREIVDSMFDIAQIDARMVQLHLTPVDTALLVRDVGAKMEKTFKERQQYFSVNISPIPKIKADPNLLEKLFQHLLSNAIKFTPNNGRINVTAKLVTSLNSDMPNGGLELIFSDSGVGVDPEARDVIFSKFYQPGDVTKHSTSKTRFKGGGTGLGLALSKGIVEVHGGRIWVESAGYDESKMPGSHFHVMLPLPKEETMIGTEVNFQIS